MSGVVRRWWPWGAIAAGAIVLMASVGHSPAALPPQGSDFHAAPSPTGGGAVRSPAPAMAAQTTPAAGTPASSRRTSSAHAAIPPSPAPTLSAPTSIAQSPTTTPAPALEPDAPAELTIEGLGVRAPIDPIWAVGGQLVPPDDPSRVGWWQASALAGSSAGSTVLIGHVDSARYGPGALFDLTRLQPDDTLSVVTAGGTTDYEVTSRQTLEKDDGLPASLFTDQGPPTLVVITCGGPFDQATRHYRDNIVITAVPKSHS